MRITRALPGLLLASLAVTGAPPARAQTLTLGNANGVNTFPFGFYAQTPPNRYQQVYAASLFPQAVFITALRLTAFSSGAQISPGDYFVRFSTTGKAVDALGTSYDANLGANTQTFFSGFLSGGLRIAGTSFFYNPAAGNLLLDVVVNSQTPPTTSFTLFAADTSSTDGMSRVYDGGQGSGATSSDSYGLVTTFEYIPATTTPEPITLALVGTGVAGMAALRRRRKQNG